MLLPFFPGVGTFAFSLGVVCFCFLLFCVIPANTGVGSCATAIATQLQKDAWQISHVN